MPTGIDVPLEALPSYLFPFQAALVRWALKRGRAGLFTGTGTGKAQPIEELVATPNGWISIGSLKIGDLALDEHGIATRVTGVFPQGMRPIYKITMNDGSCVECDIDHLWTVSTDKDIHRGNPWKAKSLREILDIGIRQNHGRLRWRIPVASPVHYQEQPYDIHPYILGVLLADGCLGRYVSFTPGDEWIACKVSSLLKTGHKLHKEASGDREQSYAISRSHNAPQVENIYLNALRKYGILGLYSEEKYIPRHYLHGSIGQRVDLLQGLMDCDGYVDERQGGAEYSTSSPLLKNGVVELVQSLGGIAKVREKIPSFLYKGERRYGIRNYTITLCLPNSIQPCTLPRKAKRYKNRERYFPQRKIASCEYVGEKEAVCIQVSSRTQLYLTKGYVVTHNTRMSLAWAQHIPGRVLIVAPLAVTQQTIREGKKIGSEPIQYARSQDEMRERICITNYDMLDHFIGVDVNGMVLDEASIIKSFSAATRKALIAHFRHMPYRLCCTATPAPNSTEEIGNYAEWLGVMTLNDMRSTFFVHDESGWRLMEHAREPFYRWLASWAMTLRGPADIGFDGSAFQLPLLHMVEHILAWGQARLIADGDGQLGIPGTQQLKGIADRMAVRQQTTAMRVADAAKIAQQTDGQMVVWAGLNEESELMTKALDGESVIEVKGNHSREEKERRLLAFLDGTYRILVSKASIAGYGLNMQCASTAIFLGLNDSWESYYQAVRRIWRYGQTQEVTTHIVLSDHELPIWKNVQRKERDANTMIDGLIQAVRGYEEEELQGKTHAETQYTITTHTGEDWTLHHGDCVEGMRKIAEQSIGLCVYSPPFSNLFAYHASERDVGNCLTEEQFFSHHSFVADQLLRVMKPGRIIAMHVMEVPAMLVRDGWIGLKNFRGHMVDHMMEKGFIHAGEVTCAKSPQPLRDGTPVLTPQGWRNIEDLQIGDMVIGQDGNGTKVVDIPYRGTADMATITFSDGAMITCGMDHLWTVKESMRGSKATSKTITTRALLENGYRTKKGRPKYAIPANESVQFDETESPRIPPQLLGALLADGNWAGQRSIALTKDSDLVLALPLPDGYQWAERPGSDRANGRTKTYGLTGPSWHKNDVLQALYDYGLGECRAWEKFIPPSYLFGSESTRRALLRGLMDGDGKICKEGGMFYSTTSAQLALDVEFLVRSLGGIAHITPTKGSIYGERKQGRTLYIVTIRMNGPWCPFTLKRKAIRWHPERRNALRHIVSITPNDPAPCTCISVQAPDGLFVADKFIVTHNSQAIRIRAKGLAFHQVHKDSSWSRPCLGDYILLFRAPGENAVPVQPDIDNDTWIIWAANIWLSTYYDTVDGYRETMTLNVAEGRDPNDTKHICPLPIDLVERCIRLWSNPSETCLDPFSGLGTVGVKALEHGRKYIGCELKDSYVSAQLRNLARAEHAQTQQVLI